MDVLSRYLPANSPRSVDKAGGNADSKDKPVQDTVKMAALRNF